MIESVYWKEDLLEHARRLKPVAKPPRWSERLVVNYEKGLMLSFFCIRKLIETNKVSNKTKRYRADVFCYAPAGKKITKMNQWDINDIYDLQSEKAVRRSILFLANQLIHSCTLYAYREVDRNWGGVFACSDFERNNTIYRIPVQEIVSILKLVGTDYPSSMAMTWDDECVDYVVKND
jgi:hypothetical protein